MAGISLPLRRLLSSRSFLAQGAGYAYAGLAMAGPWLLASAYMQIVSRLGIPGLTAEDLQSFQALVLYGLLAAAAEWIDRGRAPRLVAVPQEAGGRKPEAAE